VDSTALAIAIPVFLLAILAERWVERRRRVTWYRFADALTDLGCGVAQQASALVWGGVKIAAYAGVYAAARVAEVPADSALGWAAAILGVDLAYYWSHRLSHRVNVGWAAHVVHHQSEDYNLAVALRQSSLQDLWSLPFYLPLAVLGVPPHLFVAAATVNVLYQFWIHTRAIGSLGPLEWVLNTPSHHRVHHGIDPRYIDKNYAGILIVWDRLFGTFEAEAGEPVYGTVTPLRSWNPVWANLDVWAGLVAAARRTGRLRDAVQLFLRPPEWRPADLGGPVVIPAADRATQDRYDTAVPPLLKGYVVFGFVAVVGGLAALLVAGAPDDLSRRGALATLIVATTAGWGGLMERRRWAVPLEALRLAAAPAVVAWLAWGGPAAGPALATTTAVSALSGAWLWLATRPVAAPAAAPPAPAPRVEA